MWIVSLALLQHNDWLALAPEGGVSLADYPHIKKWIARIKALPGFNGVPGNEK